MKRTIIGKDGVYNNDVMDIPVKVHSQETDGWFYVTYPNGCLSYISKVIIDGIEYTKKQKYEQAENGKTVV